MDPDPHPGLLTQPQGQPWVWPRALIVQVRPPLLHPLSCCLRLSYGSAHGFSGQTGAWCPRGDDSGWVTVSPQAGAASTMGSENQDQPSLGQGQ